METVVFIYQWNSQTKHTHINKTYTQDQYFTSQLNMCSLCPKNIAKLIRCKTKWPHFFDLILFMTTLMNAVTKLFRFCLKLMSYDRNLIQQICPSVVSSLTSFFSYEKLRWIGTSFYSVLEIWSHVTEILCHN